MAPISYWKRKGKIELKKLPDCLTEFQLPEFYFTSKLYNVQASVPSMLFYHVNHAIVFSRAVGCIFGELLNNWPLFPVSHYATNLYNLFLVISCGCTVLILVTLSCSKSIRVGTSMGKDPLILDSRKRINLFCKRQLNLAFLGWPLTGGLILWQPYG